VGDHIFLVQDIATGNVLYNQIIEEGAFEAETAKQLIRSILKGLKDIHSKGVIHRDLKLENIILNRSYSYSELKIIDFGLSQRIGEENPIYSCCGTPGYIAPEVIKRKNKRRKYDEKCDIYSVGVILYILLCGKSPFPGSGIKQVLRLNRKNKIDFKPILDKTTDFDLLTILEQMLSKDPKERPSAKELLALSYFKETLPEEDSS